MGEVVGLKATEREKCPWCGSPEHAYTACGRVRRLKFFGGEFDSIADVEGVEFWPSGTFEFEPDPSFWEEAE